MEPTSQKNRPISFLLFDGEDFLEGRDLIIRPEEMTRQEPMRVNAVQTLGGAWVDDFGRGLSTITITGHTGWHGSTQEDGEAQFRQLRALIMTRWNSLREAKAETGSADEIKMVLSDQLNGVALWVAPQSFTLRRHKSRPLLMMYTIALVVLGEMGDWDQSVAFHASDAIALSINNPARHVVALASLSEAERKMVEHQREIQAAVDNSELVAASSMLLEKSASMLRRVRDAVSSANGVVDEKTAPLMVASINILSASRNAYRILASAYDVPIYTRNILQGIASNFHDALCNLKNGFGRLVTMPDWSDIFGASTCSSTGGGLPISPLSATNPFYEIAGASSVEPSVRISRQSVDAANYLIMDPLAAGLPFGTTTALVRSMAEGMVTP